MFYMHIYENNTGRINLFAVCEHSEGSHYTNFDFSQFIHFRYVKKSNNDIYKSLDMFMIQADIQK